MKNSLQPIDNAVVQYAQACWPEAEARVNRYLSALGVPVAIREELVEQVLRQARVQFDGSEQAVSVAMRELHAILNRQVARTQGVRFDDPLLGSAAWRVGVLRHTSAERQNWQQVPWRSLQSTREGRHFQWRASQAMPGLGRNAIPVARLTHEAKH
ncbi:MAG: hypothetical protein PHI49_00895 [Halothiobacillaceae bacterium]|nr:hypothetical protein [Halothiobacillaceae bacterium]